MFVAPSGKTYSTGPSGVVPSDLSTTFAVPGPDLEALSTGFPRSVRIARRSHGRRPRVVTQRFGRANRVSRLPGKLPGKQKTPEGTAEFVASNPDASTWVVAFALVAPSGKTYVTKP